MAFIGVLLLSLFGMALIIIIFFIIICAILFVFIPSLALSISNLVLGIRHHWPKHNIILLVVFGSIVALFLMIGIPAVIKVIINHAISASGESATPAALLLGTLI